VFGLGLCNRRDKYKLWERLRLFIIYLQFKCENYDLAWKIQDIGWIISQARWDMDQDILLRPLFWVHSNCIKRGLILYILPFQITFVCFQYRRHFRRGVSSGIQFTKVILGHWVLFCGGWCKDTSFWCRTRYRSLWEIFGKYP
jgi:hypothetical protein